MKDGRLIYATRGARAGQSTLNFVVTLMAGMLGAVPVSLWWDHDHAAVIANGSGGTWAGVWCGVVLLVAWPLVGLLSLGSTLGSYPTMDSPLRVVDYVGQRPSWWRCVIRVGVLYIVGGLGWIIFGLWGVVGVLLVWVVVPFTRRDRSTPSDLLSGTRLVMQVASSVHSAKYKKAREFVAKGGSAVVEYTNSRSRRTWSAVAFGGTFIAGVLLPFIVVH